MLDIGWSEIAIIVVVVLALIAWLFLLFKQREDRDKRSRYPLAADRCDQLPPSPRLEGLELVGPGHSVGRMQPGDTQLWLCFDGDPPNGEADWADPDVVITYGLEGASLVRQNQSSGATFVVAQYVQAFQLLDLGDRVQIQITFNYRGITQTYTLVARDP